MYTRCDRYGTPARQQPAPHHAPPRPNRLPAITAAERWRPSAQAGSGGVWVWGLLGPALPSGAATVPLPVIPQRGRCGAGAAARSRQGLSGAGRRSPARSAAALTSRAAAVPVRRAGGGRAAGSEEDGVGRVQREEAVSDEQGGAEPLASAPHAARRGERREAAAGGAAAAARRCVRPRVPGFVSALGATKGSPEVFISQKGVG